MDGACHIAEHLEGRMMFTFQIEPYLDQEVHRFAEPDSDSLSSVR